MRTNMGTLTVPRPAIIVRIKPSEIKVPRRFPPPWSVEETAACFIVRDSGEAKRSRMFITRTSRGVASAIIPAAL